MKVVSQTLACQGRWKGLQVVTEEALWCSTWGDTNAHGKTHLQRTDLRRRSLQSDVLSLCELCSWRVFHDAEWLYRILFYQTLIHHKAL